MRCGRLSRTPRPGRGIFAYCSSVVMRFARTTAMYSLSKNPGVANLPSNPDCTVFATPRTTSYAVWRGVANTVQSGLDGKLATPGFLESEYIAVVLANRITTLEQYAKIPRPGRGVRLSRPQRIAVWNLVEAYRRQSDMDETLSFPEVLALAAEVLRIKADSGGGHLADHVIVDEGQDLHATHWALLRALASEGPNDLFIAEDSHQRIYGSPVILSRFGIKIVGRSRRLTLNYRTTAQNLHFAVSGLS